MIEKGDIVDVYFSDTREGGLEIKYKPQATGDCWMMERPDGTEVAVMNFDKMVVTVKKANQ